MPTQCFGGGCAYLRVVVLGLFVGAAAGTQHSARGCSSATPCHACLAKSPARDPMSSPQATCGRPQRQLSIKIYLLAGSWGHLGRAGGSLGRRNRTLSANRAKRATAPKLCRNLCGDGRALAWGVVKGRPAPSSRGRSAQLSGKFAGRPSTPLAPPMPPAQPPHSIVAICMGSDEDVKSSRLHTTGTESL